MGWVEEKTGVDITPDLDSWSDFWEWIEEPFEDYYDFNKKIVQEVFEWIYDIPTYDDQAKVLINKQANNAYIPIVYGERRVGGTIVFKGVSGTDNEYLHIVLAVSEGEIEAIGDVYIDDILSTDSKYSGKVDIYKYTGTTTQAADSVLVAAFTDWTSASQGKSIAYIHARFLYDKEVFRGTPKITCDVQGKKVIDHRTSPATTAYSNNPALCIYDYLVNALSGKGLDSSLIDIASFNTAANYCENQITPHSGSPAPTINRFECNGVIDTGRSLRTNLAELRKTCRGHLLYFNGKYSLIIDKDESSSYSLTTDNIVGSWSIAGQNKRARFNRVKAEFVNPDRNWQPDIAPFDSTTFRTNDNGSLLETSLQLPFETNYYRALRYATFVCNKSRNQLVVSLTATRDALQIEPGDVIDITHDYPGWTNKLFRVIGFEPMGNGNVKLTLNFHDTNTYNFATPAQIDATPLTDLPDPYNVNPPTGLTLASGEDHLLLGDDGTIVSRIRATWTAPSDPYVDGYILEAKKSAESGYSIFQTIDGASITYAYIAPVEDAINYDVRVKARNTLQYTSTYASVTNHTVVGKTTPPDDVTSFIAAQNGNVAVFRWTQVTNVDLAGYEIRYGITGSAWDDATPLTRITRGTNITTADIPPGTWDCLIKAVDTTGNYSTNAISDSLTFVNTYDIITQVSQNPDWLGTKTNFIEHWTGVLVPDSQSLASASGWDTFDTYVFNPYTTSSYESPEIDIGFDDTVRLWSSHSDKLGPGETGLPDVELQVDFRTAAGSYDGFESWTIGNRTARYIKFKIVVTNVDTSVSPNSQNPLLYLAEYTNTVDNQEVKTNQTVIIAGSPEGVETVTFDTQYHVAPYVKPTYIGSNAYISAVDNITTTGCTVYLFNTSGAGVNGTVNLEITGV